MRLRGDQLLIGGILHPRRGVQRPALASLNAATGALTSYINAGFATTRPGSTTVLKMDITADQTTMVVIGNFTSIGAESRIQVAKFNLGANSATLSDWSTTFYSATCSSAFQTYMRDLDISPDGTYFVLSTTGAYGGSTSPCDSQARFETGASGPGNVATWVSHTGGDTTYAVAITGSAVYIGGHFRWLNNPFASDKAGAGAVPREGLAALDPRNGIPLSWNPTRTRGVGVFDMLANEQGLWIGSDTDTVYKETHRKVAFFPLAGGVVPPAEKPGTLPNDVYLIGSTANTQSTVRRQFFDGTSAAPSNPVTLTGPEAWGSARGAMLIDDDLYTAWSDGTFTVRTFDGTSFGTSSTVNLYNGSFRTDASKVTGMFFDKASGRMYYTLSGSNSLHWRGFSPESTIVGAARFTATGDVAALQPNRVAGMFLVGNTLYFADSSSAGRLYSVGFNRGVVTGPAQLVNSTIDWRARGTFVWNGTPAQGTTNLDPTAAIATPSCTGLTCTFDGSPSSDPDGQITTYAWNFGDGTTGTGRPPQHTYGDAARTPSTLTVTDNRGGTDTATASVTVAPVPNVAPTAAIAAPELHRADLHVRRIALHRPRRPDHHLRLGLRRRHHRHRADRPAHLRRRRHVHGHPHRHRQQGRTNATARPSPSTMPRSVEGGIPRIDGVQGQRGPDGVGDCPAAVQPGDGMLLFVSTNIEFGPHRRTLGMDPAGGAHQRNQQQPAHAGLLPGGQPRSGEVRVRDPRGEPEAGPDSPGLQRHGHR